MSQATTNPAPLEQLYNVGEVAEAFKLWQRRVSRYLDGFATPRDIDPLDTLDPLGLDGQQGQEDHATVFFSLLSDAPVRPRSGKMPFSAARTLHSGGRTR